MTALWSALERLPWSIAIREGSYLFPTIETVHVLAITLLVGTITIVDLRLLGLTDSGKSLRALSAQILPFTWGSFCVATISGALMFASRATVYAGTAPFQAKMGVLLAAGANMLLFQVILFRDVAQWDRLAPPPRAKLAGALSLGFWIAVVVLGRWTGFVMS